MPYIFSMNGYVKNKNLNGVLDIIQIMALIGFFINLVWMILISLGVL